MPAKKARRGRRGPRPVQEQEQPQPEDPRRSPSHDEEERGTTPDPITQSETEPGVDESEEDASARRRVAPSFAAAKTECMRPANTQIQNHFRHQHSCFILESSEYTDCCNLLLQLFVFLLLGGHDLP
jgi:hypothetical protein